MKRKIIASMLTIFLATQTVTTSVSASNREALDVSSAVTVQEDAIANELEDYKLIVKDVLYLVNDCKEKFDTFDLAESIEYLKKEKEQSDTSFIKIQDTSEMDLLNWGQKMIHVDDEAITSVPEQKYLMVITMHQSVE